MTAPGSNGNATGSKLSPLQRIAAATAAIVTLGVTATAIYQHVAPPPVVGVASTIGLDATHTITVAPDDSGNVLVTVLGYSYPLVASQTGNMARAWATDVDSAASVAVSTDANAQPVNTTRQEYVHNSDVLRYQRTLDGQHLIAIDIGPNDLTLYQATVSRATVDSLTTAIRAAATTPSAAP